MIRLQTLDKFLHPTRLQLEQRGGPSGADQAINLGVIRWELFKIHWGLSVFCAGVVRQRSRPVKNRQSSQSKKIELDQSNRFKIVLIKLCDRLGHPRLPIQRRKFRNGFRRDHQAAGMFAGVSGYPFEATAVVDKLGNLGFVSVSAPQFIILFQCLLERHADLKRHKLCQRVTKAVRHPHDPPDISHHGPCGQRVVGDNLRYLFRTVPLADVFDHPVASDHTEVDIKIRQRDSLWIQEALEQ